jgi:hypothetical protein
MFIYFTKLKHRFTIVTKTDDRLSLISNKHSQSVKSSGLAKTSTGRQLRAITIPSLTHDTVTINVRREQSNDWLMRGRDDSQVYVFI